MQTEHPDPAELAALRAAFAVTDDGASALGWEAVHAFEAQHGIVLPEPYRTFVAEITDGSHAGPPDFGLTALAELPSDWGANRPERVLAEPFPLTEAWVWEDDEPEDGDEDEDGDGDEDGEGALGPVFNHGSIVLGTDGCGMYWHLIVTGPHRGHIWFICGEGALPFGAPFCNTTAAPGFAGWVAHWAAGKEWYDLES
ncbi:SMI1/KNR4 family protein [Kitasatospora sp. NPDC059646]|uniref:SMI1/KNR4 family protein n=1 Tax=Kitasatospora sp. NPDC059646 TaxID=3346893 RepID=UPI00367CC94B